MDVSEMQMKLQNYRPFHIAVIKSVAHDVLCALYGPPYHP